MINFGACLKQLLIIRGWSAAQLARALNIDSSYVRKWTSGERVPALQTDYVKNISSFITRGFDLTLKKEALLHLLEQASIKDFSLDSPIELQNAIEALLNDAQIYSLSKGASVRKSDGVFIPDQLLKILEKDESYYSLKTFKASDIPPFISGRKNLLTTMLFILYSALNHISIVPSDIYITFQSEKEIFDGFPGIFDLWKSLLNKLLAKGWKVYYLCNLNNNSARSQNIVKAILEFSCHLDSFKPYYLAKYGTKSPASEFLVIRGIGSLVCMSSANENCVDFGFFNNQPESITSLCNHAEILLRQSKPLTRVLNTQNEYFEFITAKDKQPGNLFIASFDLYTHTIPLKLWEKYLLRSLGNVQEVDEHMRRITERIDTFNNDINRYKVKNIFEMKAVEYLIKNCKYLYHNTYQICNPEDVLEHLENIIYLLNTFENYEIALLSENQRDVLKFIPWEVKGDHSVALTFPKNAHKGLPSYAIITENNISNAFHDYFIDIWEHIVPNYRDKNFVISWFKEQALWYKNNILKRS